MTLVAVGVTLAAGPRTLLRDLSFTIADGAALTLMGPSGVGKSSLVAYLGGALPHGVTGTGRVLVDGADVTSRPAHRRRIGTLFQDDLLFPHLSIEDNLLFGLPREARARAATAAAALASVDLAGLGPRAPSTLSGGQRARVALLRVLLSRPRALLLDEPFGALDAALRAQVRDLVITRARDAGLPLLLVTHDPAEAVGEVLTLAR